MGTTVVAAVLSDQMIRIVHAGDSRAYKVSPKGIVQMTRDHSIVQELVETGKLTPNEAKARSEEKTSLRVP